MLQKILIVFLGASSILGGAIVVTAAPVNYVGSNGEGNSPATSFGRINSTKNTVSVGSNVYNPWCYDFIARNNAPGATISRCGGNYGWSVFFPGSVSSTAQKHPNPKKIAASPKSWYLASEAELSKFALEHLRRTFRILSGTPRVVLVKRLKNKDLEPLGIYPESALDDNFPVALIILKAHVDVAGGIVGVTKYTPAAYVGYVIELESGSIRTMTSRVGGRFKKALKDNSLPNDEDTLTPAQKKMLKEEAKLPEAKVVPLPYPFRFEPKRTCKICVQGL